MPAREVEAAELREARRLLIGAGRGEAAVQCLGQRERQTLGEHRTPRRCQHENNQTKQLCGVAQHGPSLPLIRSAYRTTSAARLPACTLTGKTAYRPATRGSGALQEDRETAGAGQM